MGILEKLGIYPESIGNAWEECQNALENQGLDERMSKLEGDVSGDVEELVGSNLTNEIIGLMFEACKNIIEEAHPGQDVTYYVNGYDSHLYPGTNPESVEGRLETAGLTFEEMKEILADEGFENDLTELFGIGGDVILYESEAECGADHADNGCRDENDTDEGFCRFLAENYKDNYSGPRDICIILNSGRVLMASE